LTQKRKSRPRNDAQIEKEVQKRVDALLRKESLESEEAQITNTVRNRLQRRRAPAEPPKRKNTAGSGNGKGKTGAKKKKKRSDTSEEEMNCSEDSSSTTSSSSSSRESTEEPPTKVSKQQATTNTTAFSESPQLQPQLQQIRPVHDKYLEESNASNDSEKKVLHYVRKNIDQVNEQLRDKAAAPPARRRSSTGVSRFDELLKEKLFAWLNFTEYVEGMETISKRLSLSKVIPFNKRNREVFVESFISRLLLWYSDETVVDGWWKDQDASV
jgi:hypothetical protein